jgi:hypothetical protein
MAADPPPPASPDGEGPDDEVPPVGGSWGRLYAVVLASLAVAVALLALLTWAYR